MISLDDARSMTREWNAVHHPPAHVLMETVEQAVLYLRRWQHAIQMRFTPDLIDHYLRQHNELCAQIPDDLLLQLFEDDFPCPEN